MNQAVGMRIKFLSCMRRTRLQIKTHSLIWAITSLTRARKSWICSIIIRFPAAMITSSSFPLLQSPKLLKAVTVYGLDINQASTLQSSSFSPEEQRREQSLHLLYGHQNNNRQPVDPVTDWRVLDKFVASQLSQDDLPKENNSYSNATNNIFHSSDQANMVAKHLSKQETAPENASTSTPGSQIEIWK